MAQLVAVLCLLLCLWFQFIGAEDVFYVKPTSGSTDCPPDALPCHTLQEYATNYSFTNDSTFLFLEGEHHLEMFVHASNVANLSLIGNSSGVEIICTVPKSGFFIEQFSCLIMENLDIVNCYGIGVSIRLETGFEAFIENVTIAPGSGGTGLTASDVEGSFTIANSNFIATPKNKNRLWFIQYDACTQHSHFQYFNNTATKLDSATIGISLSLRCSGVTVEIVDSIFDNKTPDSLQKIVINYEHLMNNSIVVSNTEFRNTEVLIHTCDGNHCQEIDLECNREFLGIREVNVVNSAIGIHMRSPLTNCTFFIEDSEFTKRTISSQNGDVAQLTLDIDYDPEKSEDDTTIQGVLHGITFANNQNKERNVLFILRNVVVLIKDCIFENNTYSAIHASWSKVVFQGNNIFRNNTSLVGGGMQLLDSYMYLRPNTSVLFENNIATYVGGAIYTEFKLDINHCFFHVDPLTFNNSISVSFVNNTAKFSGTSIYGGGINHCCLTPPCVSFSEIFDIDNTETDPSAISSDPYDVCFCDDGMNQPDCSVKAKNYSAYRGQEIPVRLAVVGSRIANDIQPGVVSGAIRAYFDPYESIYSVLGHLQKSQSGDSPYCQDFLYLVNSTSQNLTLFLNAEQTFLEEVTRNYFTGGPSASLTVTVTLKDCPLGFSLSKDKTMCECDRILSENFVQCDINTEVILRPAGNKWIGFVVNESSDISGVLFHPNCPIGYCVSNAVNIIASTSDLQCEPHRTGLLCGMCDRSQGYSLKLGNGECGECQNTYLFIILAMAIAGPLLVAILFALNLTVTEGSINGLIFYANVIGMNYNVLFTGSKLYWFVAWLNLDLGIGVCLYDGMDGYAETWLQLIFPVYLWIIILGIIKLYSRFPVLANRLGGANAVQVLATLLLLSYTKLQRTVVTIFAFTWLKYPDGNNRYVWLYDANIEFFKGNHLYLGIAGVFFLVLIILYTLCLAFFQQLQACSSHRLFQWVNNLKPVFDAYAGPYKDKYRFWTGMLLAVRTLLIILFTVADTEGSPDINLLIILVVSFVLLMAHSNGTYKIWFYNYLEAFFYLQLGVFAAGIAYVKASGGNTTNVADTSFGLSLFVFLAVIGYHVLQRLKKCYYSIRGYNDITESIDYNRKSGNME